MAPPALQQQREYVSICDACHGLALWRHARDHLAPSHAAHVHTQAHDLKRKVCIVEKGRIGGTGLHDGALASKTMWEVRRRGGQRRGFLRPLR